VENKRPGSVAFFSGLALLGTGLLATPLVGLLLSTPLVLIGLGLLLYGLTGTGRKAAGRACASCGVRIQFEHDAEICDSCTRPVHGRCAAEHKAVAHKVEQGQPFR
jgi:hypothetical protein